jgi:hypothetical protein
MLFKGFLTTNQYEAALPSAASSYRRIIMIRVGDKIAEGVRLTGNEMYKEWPYTFAHDIDSYHIWDQRNGNIIWVGKQGQLGAEGYKIACEMCWIYNGGNPYDN